MFGRLRIPAALIAGALVLCAPALAADRTMAIGTAPAGGFFYPLGGVFAKILSEQIAGLEVTAEATGGAVENLKLVASDPTYLGLANSDVAYDAFSGRGKFTAALPVRTLTVVLPAAFYFVTTDGAGIANFADLKGKRVSTNLPGSGIEVTALQMISAAGLDPDKDMTREKMSIPDSVAALKDGKIDAFFMNGSIVSAPLLDLAATPGLKMKLVSTGEYVDQLNAKFGQVYTHGVIPAGTYPTVTDEIAVSNTWNLLVVNEALSDDDAYAFVKALFEHKDEVAVVVKDAALAVANQVSPKSSIPVHPGALKYFQEQGLATQ